MNPEIVSKGTPKVLLALPWQKTVNPLTAFCTMALHDPRRTAISLHFGDAFVAHSRNHCAANFLQCEALEWMLMLDDDMVFPFGDAAWFNGTTKFNLPEEVAGRNTLDRLLSHGKTLVGGFYVGRQDSGRPMFGEGGQPAVAALLRKGVQDVLRPTRWVATGCMLVHRSVFLDVEKTFPSLKRDRNGKGGHWFSASEHTLTRSLGALEKELLTGEMTGAKAISALRQVVAMRLEVVRESTLGMGEDVTFCVRAAASGHQPYVDLGLVCGHIGHRIYGPGNTG